MGSSKLYHYAYPFLPPLTLAAGYVLALICMLAPVVVRKLLERAEDLAVALVPRLRTTLDRPAARLAGAGVIWMAALLIVWAWLFGVVRVGVDSVQLFKSSGIMRPLAAMIIAGILTRRSALVATLVVFLTVLWWMPVTVYESTIRQLSVEKHPLRDASVCVQQVEGRANSGNPAGLYVDTDSSMWHPIYYYFRRIQPWTRQTTPAPEILDRNLHDRSALRPSLVQENRYREYLHGADAARFAGSSPPMISMFEYVLLLPGEYSSGCAEAARRPAPTGD
jgi:hypothetical protein